MTCKFCDRYFERGQQLAGHTVHCKLNPQHAITHAKIVQRLIGKSLSQATRDKLSSIVSAKIGAGTWHSSFAKRRKHAYHNAIFDGTWELKFAQWCDAHAVQWERNVRSFPYTFEGTRQYTPDFYLPNIDCYIEIKGWAVDKDRAKWSQFPARLLVLRGEDLQALGIDVEVKEQKRF